MCDKNLYKKPFLKPNNNNKNERLLFLKNFTKNSFYPRNQFVDANKQNKPRGKSNRFLSNYFRDFVSEKLSTKEEFSQSDSSSSYPMVQTSQAFIATPPSVTDTNVIKPLSYNFSPNFKIQQQSFSTHHPSHFQKQLSNFKNRFPIGQHHEPFSKLYQSPPKQNPTPSYIEVSPISSNTNSNDSNDVLINKNIDNYKGIDKQTFTLNTSSGSQNFEKDALHRENLLLSQIQYNETSNKNNFNISFLDNKNFNDIDDMAESCNDVFLNIPSYIDLDKIKCSSFGKQNLALENETLLNPKSPDTQNGLFSENDDETLNFFQDLFGDASL